MTAVGDPTAWLDLIESQVPNILELILSSWQNIPPLAPDALEDPTTEALCRALRQNRNSSNLPFRIDIQMVELDPADGEDQGRLDIAFSPSIPREAYYFCLECKRLNVHKNGRLRTYGTEYVTHGMLRFVRRQYGALVRHGGMLGYVLDGRVDNAVRMVRRAVHARRAQLGMAAAADMTHSSFWPRDDRLLETVHARGTPPEPFLIQHIFATGLRSSPP